MEFKDYYATLGVAKTATEKEIKQAYRKLARKHHPDVNPGDKAAEARFKEINEAYEVLGDPEKRKKYDELGANWRMYEQAGGAARPVRRPPGGWNVALRRRQPGGGFRTMTAEEMREMFGDADPFSDFFHTFFGGGGGAEDAGRRGRAAAGAREPRRAATSSRRSSWRSRTPFTARRGGCRSSTTATRGRSTSGFRPASATARACGSPAKANRDAAARQSGDLYLRIRLAPHPRFERKGHDLYTRVPVPLTTAVLGGEAEVPTLGGKSLRLQDSADDAERPGVPAEGPRHADRRQAGRDRRPLRDGRRRSCRATLTAEQRAHFEALQKLEGRTAKSWQSERRRRTSTVTRTTMNINKYTEKAQEAVARRAAARRADEPRADRARAPAGRARRAARRHRARGAAEDGRRPGADRAAARASCSRRCRRPTAARSPACRRACKLVTDLAQAEAERLKDEYVSTEHLLVAIAVGDRAAPLPPGC